MIPDHITLPIWIVSQIITVIALIMIIFAMQAKVKTKTLILTILFNFLMATATILLQNWILVGIFGVAVFRDLVFIWREKYFPNNQPISYTTLVLFLVISTVVSLFTASWWFDYLLMTCSLFVIFGSWAKGIHLIRISRFVLSSLAIVNHIMFFNITGVVVEVFSLLAITYFYFNYFRMKRSVDNTSRLSNENS